MSAPIPIGTVRTSEIVAALSCALDVTGGLPPGHAARTCYLALRLADRMAIAGLVGADVFYGAMYFRPMPRIRGRSRTPPEQRRGPPEGALKPSLNSAR